MSLRVYWMSTSRRSSLSRSNSWPTCDLDRPVEVFLRGAQAVDRGDGRDHDHVAPGEQGHRRRVPQPLDLLVDRGVLLDVGVGLRDVRLGLVVVVVADEVFDRVVRQQLAELLGQLGAERLVGRHDQRRPLQPLDQPRGGGALAGAGRAEQHAWRSPRRTRRSSSSIAAGWSPAGLKSLTTSKRRSRRGMSSAMPTTVRRGSDRYRRPIATTSTWHDRLRNCDCVSQITGLPSIRRPLAAADRAGGRPSHRPVPPGTAVAAPARPASAPVWSRHGADRPPRAVSFHPTGGTTSVGSPPRWPIMM